MMYVLLAIRFRLDTLAKITLGCFAIIWLIRSLDFFLFKYSIVLVEIRSYVRTVANFIVYYFVLVMMRVNYKLICDGKQDYKRKKKMIRICMVIIFVVIIVHAIARTFRYVTENVYPE